MSDVALAGTTGSTDFISSRPAVQQELSSQPAQTQMHGSQGQPDAFVATLDATTRHLAYGYDGVQRLTSVTETLGNAYTYTYAYDPAGNRTDAAVNGTPVQHDTYDAANQVLTATAVLAT